jgi:galactitol-specific phosphotransferase system IIB component
VIAQACEAKVATSKRLASNVDKVAEKKHTPTRDQHVNLTDSDEDVRDAVTSRGTTQNLIDVAQLSERQRSSYEHETDPFRRNLAKSSGVVSRYTAH